MLYVLTIPKTISDINEIRILEWHFSEGEKFELGDLILEIETQKAIIEIRAQQAGFFRRIYHQAGDWIILEKLIPLALFSDLPSYPLPDSLENINSINIDANIV
jgi:pyruvate dehydrogenase E2 component (dihydrolipoamide acetyltransferase)